jgi:hypothetical protein
MWLRVDELDIEIATSASPRILGLRRSGGSNVFARLPNAGIDLPHGGRFRFIGGHRLWRAPEVPEVTYRFDELDDLEHDGASVTMRGIADSDGIVKRLTVSAGAGGLVVEHTLEHQGSRPVETAPWAITQLVPGGTAYVPFGPGTPDEGAVLSDRRLVLWPYTDLDAPELSVGRSMITVLASPRPSKTKIGVENTRGWIAYVLNDQLFVTWAPVHREDRVYPDRGASLQCFRDERFVELETLGPLERLNPGDRVSHTEMWHLSTIDPSDIDAVLAALPAVPEGGSQ